MPVAALLLNSACRKHSQISWRDIKIKGTDSVDFVGSLAFVSLSAPFALNADVVRFKSGNFGALFKISLYLICF